MKKCPVCGAECFDDMETCFECLHSFKNETQQEEKTPIEQMEEAAMNSRLLGSGSRSGNVPNNPTQQDRQQYLWHESQQPQLIEQQYQQLMQYQPQQQSLQQHSMSTQHNASTDSANFSYTFGGHEVINSVNSPNKPTSTTNITYATGATEIVNTTSAANTTNTTGAEKETNVLNVAAPANTVTATNTVDMTNTSSQPPTSETPNRPPIEIPIDGRSGNVRCTILEDDSVLPTSNYEDGMQTWVLRLGIPLDCEGVTVRLERA